VRIKPLLTAAPRRLIETSVNAMPDVLLRRLEVRVQRARGKGYVSMHSEEVRAALSLLPSSARVAPTVCDVGANRGDWTVELLNQTSTAAVHCFEPSSAAFQRLSEMLGGDTRCTLVNTGLGVSAGRAMLFSDIEGSGLASLTRRRLQHFGIDMPMTEPITVTTLDEYCVQHGIAPDLIKIDVEGHELDVLHGARRTLESASVVQFEFGGTHIDTRIFFQDFWYFFTELGFRLSRLAPRRLLPVDCYSERDECPVMSNFFGSR